MDFIKKNYGLLLFLIICLGVIIYQLIALTGVQDEREKSQALRKEHLDRLQKVRSSGLRFDEANQAKADRVAQQAKAKYLSFAHNLWERQLLPGIDFTVDPDEAAESAPAAPEPEYDEDGNPIPVKPKVDPYKDLPYRRMFDHWMTGSLADAREMLTNELMKINSKYFKSDDADDGDEQILQGTPQERLKQIEEKKRLAEKRAAEEKEAAKEAGKSTYDFEKERRTKVVKGMNVPEFFMFEEYVRNRENGLNNLKEQRGVFRQLLLLRTIVELLQKAEITELDAIDFPCGLEILDGDKYTSTPVTLSMTGKPECIESFLNLLNANEHYIFYLRDIVSFNADVQLNEDPTLAFNSDGDRAGSAQLKSFLASSGTNVETGMGAGGASHSGRGGMGGAPMGGMPEGGTRRRSVQTKPMDMGFTGGGPGMGAGMEDGANRQPLAPERTRKAYRIFTKEQEETASSASRGDMAGMGTGENRNSNSAELGTRVSVTVNFEYVEFKPVSE